MQVLPANTTAKPFVIPPLLPQRHEIAPQSSAVIFFCKDCRKLVETTRFGKKYVYICTTCKTKNVAFGTIKSVASYFHLKEHDVASAPKI